MFKIKNLGKVLYVPCFVLGLTDQSSFCLLFQCRVSCYIENILWWPESRGKIHVIISLAEWWTLVWDHRTDGRFAFLFLWLIWYSGCFSNITCSKACQQLKDLIFKKTDANNRDYKGLRYGLDMKNINMFTTSEAEDIIALVCGFTTSS